jgi:hypothetical protein
MDCKTICLQFIKLVTSFYILCVAILCWCFDYKRHFRVNSSTSENTGKNHIQGISIHFLWHIPTDLSVSLGTHNSETTRYSLELNL